MELLQLQYFEMIARYENISRAAEKLHVSQPSLSSSLLRLERELGYPLFDRNGRKIILNDYGRYFLKNVHQIMDLIAASRLPDNSEVLSGKIAVAFQNHNDAILKKLRAFHNLNPQIHMYIYQSTLSESFAIRSFDFIVSNSERSFPYPMDSLVLSRRGWYVVVPANSHFAQNGHISLDELRHKDFCFLQDSQGNMEDSYRICLDNKFIPRSIITTNSPYYKMELISRTGLFGFIPTGWHESYQKLDNIKLIPLEGYEHYTDIRLFWKENALLSEAAAAFLEFVKE